MATGYDDLIPAKTAPVSGYADLIPKRSTPKTTPQERGFFETLGAPIQAASEGVISGVGNVMFGGQELLGRGLQAAGATDTGAALAADAQRRRAESQGRVAPFKQEFPMATGTGELAAEIGATFPVGGMIAAPLRAVPAAAPLAQAIRTGGFSTGRTVQGGAARAADLGIRAAGGATLGGASSALINPDEAATGAMIGGAIPLAGAVAGPTLGYVGGKIANLRSMSQNRAANLAQQAAGTDLKEVVNALRNAPPGVGISQVLAQFENPTLQALVKDSLESTPEGAQYLSKLGTMTEKQAVNELAKIAGGVTASETRATIETAKNNLNAMTGPQRNAALNRANLGRDVAAYEAQAGKLSAEAAAEVQKVRDLISAGNAAEAWARLDLIKRGLPVGATPYTYFGELSNKALNEWSSQAATASLDLGQGARFAQGAADALRSVGIKPLETAPLIQSIKSVTNKPEFAGNDLLAGAAKNVADDIAKWTSSNGVVDAVALEAIRKNSVNAAIQQLRPGADATTQRNLAASVMSKIKPLIDDAIESAGGVGWRDYLTAHAKGMQQIAEKKLSGEALKLYKKDKDAFVRLVQGESDDVVEKILGPGNYNIALELADSTMATLRKQASDHLDRLSASKQATEGQKALATLVAQNTSALRFPSLINAWAAAGNKTISELEKRLGFKTTKMLSDAMQNPQTAANLFESLPPSEQSKIIQLLNNPSTLGLKGAAITRAAATPAAPINALAPAQQNQNALAP
jgi:hypothetical protein